MNTLFKSLLIILGAISLIFIVSFFYAFIISICWNYIMPKIFGLPKIGYWDAYVMALLSGCLFKSSASIKKD